MLKAPELDWDEIDAARVRARKLHSETGFRIFVAVGHGIRRTIQATWNLLVSGNLSSMRAALRRNFNGTKVISPLDRGLRAGWY